MDFIDFPRTFDSNFLSQVSPNVWLMDDHKWAYYIWEKFANDHDAVKRSLYHFDYHWDGTNDFREESSFDLLKSCTLLKDIYTLVKEGNLIRYDSFIAPAVIRGLINKIHFYCCQYDEETGICESILEKYSIEQHIHNSLESILNTIYGEDMFFDIDLDLFNNNNDEYLKGDLWGQKDIISLLKHCGQLIKNAKVVTIAMSYGYSGSIQDTIYLTQLVVPMICKMRDQSVL